MWTTCGSSWAAMRRRRPVAKNRRHPPTLFLQYQAQLGKAQIATANVLGTANTQQSLLRQRLP